MSCSFNPHSQLLTTLFDKYVFLEGVWCNDNVGGWRYPAAVYCGCLYCDLWCGLWIWDWGDRG